MQKWIATILLIISVACSIIPCCQFDDCAGDQLSTEQSSHEKEDEGVCSPFFACTTCAGFTQLVKPLQLQRPAVQKQEHYSAIARFYLSEYSVSFWQPPRLL